MFNTTVDSHGHHTPVEDTTLILSFEDIVPVSVIMSLQPEAGAELQQEVIWM